MLNLKIFCNVYIFYLITSLLKDISAVLGEISRRSHPGVKGLIWEVGVFFIKSVSCFYDVLFPLKIYSVDIDFYNKHRKDLDSVIYYYPPQI